MKGTGMVQDMDIADQVNKGKKKDEGLKVVFKSFLSSKFHIFAFPNKMMCIWYNKLVVVAH